MTDKKTFFSIVIVFVVVGSTLLAYPDQTIAFIDDFLSGDRSYYYAQIWRVKTKNTVSRTDIQVDFCLMTRDGKIMGEPSSYHKGYIAFTEHPVVEGENITLYLEKENYVPLNISFLVPRIDPLYGGQTYYTLSEAFMYPIPPIEILPWILEHYCMNYTIYCLLPANYKYLVLK
jgi:hypothetical protein